MRHGGDITYDDLRGIVEAGHLPVALFCPENESCPVPILSYAVRGWSDAYSDDEWTREQLVARVIYVTRQSWDDAHGRHE